MASPGITGTPAFKIYHSFWNGVDLLFPPHCAGCGKLGERWCQECKDQVQPLPPTVCSNCGSLIPSSGVCATCQRIPPEWDGLRSWAWFAGPLREALHRLKYGGDLSIGELFTQPLYDLLQSVGWQIDLLTCIPISVERKAERGYNQTTFITLPLALRSRISYKPQALQKVRETRSQVGLTARERQENVNNAFRADPQLVRGKRVLVVDDLITTGATLAACAGVLKAGGAAAVYGLTVARAPLGNAQRQST